MPLEHDVSSLVSFLKRIPAVVGAIGSGTFDNGNWWTKFTIDIDHPQAWNVVQELGYVLNYLSVNERLPTAPAKPRLRASYQDSSGLTIGACQATFHKTGTKVPSAALGLGLVCSLMTRWRTVEAAALVARFGRQLNPLLGLTQKLIPSNLRFDQPS